MDLFNRVLGVYVHEQGEQLPEFVRNCNVQVRTESSQVEHALTAQLVFARRAPRCFASQELYGRQLWGQCTRMRCTRRSFVAAIIYVRQPTSC